MDVSGDATHAGGFELQDTGDLEVLADLEHLIVQVVVHLAGLVGVVSLIEETIDAIGGGLAHEFLGESDEVLVLGDEVGFAVQFEERRGATVGGDLNSEDALAGLAVSLLVARGDSLDAEDFDGLLVVAIGFNEGLLAIHQTRTGTLAQIVDRLSGDSGHGRITWTCGGWGASQERRLRRRRNLRWP